MRGCCVVSGNELVTSATPLRDTLHHGDSGQIQGMDSAVVYYINGPSHGRGHRRNKDGATVPAVPLDDESGNQCLFHLHQRRLETGALVGVGEPRSKTVQCGIAGNLVEDESLRRAFYLRADGRLNCRLSCSALSSLWRRPHPMLCRGCPPGVGHGVKQRDGRCHYQRWKRSGVHFNHRDSEFPVGPGNRVRRPS